MSSNKILEGQSGKFTIPYKVKFYRETWKYKSKQESKRDKGKLILFAR